MKKLMAIALLGVTLVSTSAFGFFFGGCCDTCDTCEEVEYVVDEGCDTCGGSYWY